MSFDEYIKHSTDQLTRLTTMVAELQQQVYQLKEAERISYSLPEAARVTGITYETLYKRCKAGAIKYSQNSVGGTIIITRAELDQYLEQTRVTPDIDLLKAEVVARTVRSGKSALRIAHKREAANGKKD